MSNGQLLCIALKKELFERKLSFFNVREKKKLNETGTSVRPAVAIIKPYLDIHIYSIEVSSLSKVHI